MSYQMTNMTQGAGSCPLLRRSARSHYHTAPKSFLKLITCWMRSVRGEWMQNNIQLWGPRIPTAYLLSKRLNIVYDGLVEQCNIFKKHYWKLYTNIATVHHYIISYVMCFSIDGHLNVTVYSDWIFFQVTNKIYYCWCFPVADCVIEFIFLGTFVSHVKCPRTKVAVGYFWGPLLIICLQFPSFSSVITCCSEYF